MTSKPRSFLAVEDDPRLRGLLMTALCPPGWRATVAASGGDALDLLGRREVSPSVMLVDLGLPDMDGGALIEGVAVSRPEVPIVVLTICTEEARILDAIRRGACGYLFKEDLARGLGAALDEASAGGAPMSRAVARLVLGEVRRDRAPAGPTEKRPQLTERERQVVAELARGLSYAQVAATLDISTNTVRTYVKALYEKLCATSKTEAVLEALRFGLIPPPT